MIHGNVIIPDELFKVNFCCDLIKCQGACCVEGDAGAPLDEAEIELIMEYSGCIEPFMTETGIKTVNEAGFFDYDEKGDFVTPLVNGAACAYCSFRDGTAICAIEEAYDKGAIAFRKPVSCHLYPIRIKFAGQFEKLVYHRWNICKPALRNGNEKGVNLLVFVKDALIRRFGSEWYESLLNRMT